MFKNDLKKWVIKNKRKDTTFDLSPQQTTTLTEFADWLDARYPAMGASVEQPILPNCSICETPFDQTEIVCQNCRQS